MRNLTANPDDTSIELQIRKRWQWAINKIIFSNKLIHGTRKFVGARKRTHKKDLYLGYMITNFNHLTFENGDALELMLDWFEAANTIFKLPGQVMERLVKGYALHHMDH